MGDLREAERLQNWPSSDAKWAPNLGRLAGWRGSADNEYHAGIFGLPLFLAQRFTFGFVRHPVTWLQSAWAWAVVTGFPWKMTCRS